MGLDTLNTFWKGVSASIVEYSGDAVIGNNARRHHCVLDVCPRDGQTVKTILGAADRDLYRVKTGSEKAEPVSTQVSRARVTPDENSPAKSSAFHATRSGRG